jgi:hypothetical protein
MASIYFNGYIGKVIKAVVISVVIWAEEAESMMGQGLQVENTMFALNWRGFCINFQI